MSDVLGLTSKHKGLWAIETSGGVNVTSLLLLDTLSLLSSSSSYMSD